MELKPRVAVALASFLLAVIGATAPPIAAQPAPDDADDVWIVDAFAYDPEIEAEGASGTQAEIEAEHARAAREAAREGGAYKTIQLDGLLAVQVSDARPLLGDGGERCGEMRLTFDRIAFAKNVPYRCTADLVVFNLAMFNRADEKAWQNLVQKRRGITAFANISLQRGKDGEPLRSETTDREIKLYNRLFAWIAGVGFAGVFWGFVRLARRSNLIRDGGEKRAPGERLRPYSLARVQTAWWFFLVLFGFLFISLLDGSLTEIPNSILGLMGIAGGTFLGSELVDSSRRKAAERGEAPDTYPVASKAGTGFFIDIFSDDSGVAFHRFQMSVWTVALGVIFVIRVLRNLEMPQFETSILGLMGISSGTYLGMKLPEMPKGKAEAEMRAATRDGGRPQASAPPEADF